MTDGPLIVQSDKTVLLEVDHPQADVARRAVAAFADLERAPEHIHTYRITPLGLWNARAAGFDAEYVVDTLLNHSRFPVPHSLLVDIAETMSRYGRLRLEKDPVHGLVLRSQEEGILSEVLHAKTLTSLLGPQIDDTTVAVHGQARGELKQQLLRLGWPAEDLAGFVDGTAHRSSCARTAGRCADISRKPWTTSGRPAPEWWCCPAGRERPSSAPRPWRPPEPSR